MWYIEGIAMRVNVGMKGRTITIIFLMSLIVLSLPKTELPTAHAIGVANVIVQNVFWGTDPTNPITVHPGDVNVQLNIVLTNVGDDVARNVNGTISLTPPIDYNYFLDQVRYSADSVTKAAGDIDAGASYTLTYILTVEPSAKQGVYHYHLLLSYQSARELQEVNKTVEIDAPVTFGELHIQSVSTNPVKLFPDSYANQVTITIANSGNGIAKDVQVYLELSQPFSASSSGSAEIFVGNIPAGQTLPANFVIDVAENATWGQYSATLLQVIENNQLPIGQVPLYVAEKVIFQIVSVTPTVVHPGDSADVISVLIKNTSNDTRAESVRVELQVGNYWTGTLTDFLGDMTQQQNKTAVFTVAIDSSEPTGTYPCGLRFDWTQNNNQFSLDHTYPITLHIERGRPPITLFVILVAVIVVAAGYFFMRKRRKVAKLVQQLTSVK
jgi:hypothetical protein